MKGATEATIVALLLHPSVEQARWLAGKRLMRFVLGADRGRRAGTPGNVPPPQHGQVQGAPGSFAGGRARTPISNGRPVWMSLVR